MKCMSLWIDEIKKNKLTKTLKDRSLTVGGFIKLVIDRVLDEEDDFINYILKG